MKENLSQCHNCGGYFEDSQMADWTICYKCLKEQVEANIGEEVFIDSLGIAWTQSEIEDAGGINEVEKMSYDADIRNNLTQA